MLSMIEICKLSQASVEASADGADVLCDAFNATRWRDRLELQLSEMFRTGFFNSVRRKQLAGPSPDTLKLKQLFKLKYESGDACPAFAPSCSQHVDSMQPFITSSI